MELYPTSVQEVATLTHSQLVFRAFILYYTHVLQTYMCYCIHPHVHYPYVRINASEEKPLGESETDVARAIIILSGWRRSIVIFYLEHNRLIASQPLQGVADAKGRGIQTNVTKILRRHLLNFISFHLIQ